MAPTSTTLRRLAFGVSFLIVAGVAAVNSYEHMRDVALLGHQPNLLASTLPLSVDGLLVIASLAMAEDKAQYRHPRTWARIAFWFGAVVSETANIASTAVHHGDALSIGVAAWPPLALLVVVEIMTRPGRPNNGQVQHSAPHAPAAAPTSPGMPPVVADTAEALAYRRAAAELRRTSKLAAFNVDSKE